MKGDPSIMDILQEIYQTVDNIVQRRLEQSGLNNQIQAIVLGSSNGKYIISVNGAKYSVRDGVGINPQPNTPVWVCVPSNDWNKAYICAGKGTSTGGSGNVDDVYQNGNSVLGEDHIARIRCATPEDIEQLQANFQDGVEAIGDACTRKGSTPASSSLEDTVAAIDAIQTGGNYDTLDVSFGPEGTIYDAKDYPGIDAWNIVRVVPPEGPFTVRFFDVDRQTIIKTDAAVPYDGNASCTIFDGTVRDGQYFKGWNPSPVNVKENMNCYPVYGDYVIDENEIQDSWETICERKGEGYSLGSYKALILDIDINNGDVLNEFKGIYNNNIANFRTIAKQDLQHAVTTNFHMIKVAEGEDGSSSSWISTGCLIFKPYTNINVEYQRWNEDSQEWVTVLTQSLSLSLVATHCHDIQGAQADWSTSWLRSFLNLIVLPNLPTYIKNVIKIVTKHTYGYSSIYSTAIRVEKESFDAIWVPSMKELEALFSSYTPFTADCYPSAFNDVIEYHGIDYSSVYVPTYPTAGAPAAFITRTMVSHISTGVISMWLCGNSANNQYGSWQRFSGQTGWFPIGFCM